MLISVLDERTNLVLEIGRLELRRLVFVALLFRLVTAITFQLRQHLLYGIFLSVYLFDHHCYVMLLMPICPFFTVSDCNIQLKLNHNISDSILFGLIAATLTVSSDL